MRPFFTSRTEWHLNVSGDQRTYVRGATGHLVRAALLGLLILVGPVGAVDAYWRSAPVLVLFAVTLSAGTVLGALLFRREWLAAVHTYGMPTRVVTTPPRAAT